MRVDVGEEVSPETRVAEEVERDDPHVSVHVSDKDEHGPLSQNTPDAPRVAALEEPPFVPQHETVQPRVRRHYRRFPKQLRLVYLPVPI